MICVRDVMQKEIVTARADYDIPEITKLLTENKVSNIPIIDDKRGLVGIVSEQDILRAMKFKDFLKMKARDIMTKDVLSVKEDDGLEYVSQIFIEHPFRRLPVTKDGKVVGIVTREDVVKNFMSDYY